MFKLLVWSKTDPTDNCAHFYDTLEDAIAARAICALDDLETKLYRFINAYEGYWPMKGE